MADVHTREQRSRNMASIRGKDTRPEKIVRSMLHRLGYRFRLHRRDLPGKPDLVFPARRKVILVHGCFWHMHKCRWGKVTPATNTDFWQTKRKGNCDRDRRVLKSLAEQGWKAFVVWECQTRNADELSIQLVNFLA